MTKNKMRFKTMKLSNQEIQIYAMKRIFKLIIKICHHKWTNYQINNNKITIQVKLLVKMKLRIKKLLKMMNTINIIRTNFPKTKKIPSLWKEEIVRKQINRKKLRALSTILKIQKIINKN